MLSTTELLLPVSVKWVCGGIEPSGFLGCLEEAQGLLWVSPLGDWSDAYSLGTRELASSVYSSVGLYDGGGLV